MLGPLCRLPNWCEVEEVEEELRAREVSPITGRARFGALETHDTFPEIRGAYILV